MASPATNVASLINTAAIATTGTDLFISVTPPSPDSCVAVFDTTGPSPNPKYNRSTRDVQIMVRGEDYTTTSTTYTDTWDKCIAIKDLLLGHPNEVFVDETYTSFLMKTGITFIGYDSLNRPQMTLNFRITIDGPTVGNRLEIA